MGEGKTSMFGKTYNTIGSTDSNFIIKTKGDLKVQWGGKFIDVIKNGKLASSGASILKTVSSSEDISSNGIYLIPTEVGNEVWVSIDGTKVNLTGEIGTTYVSFLAEQKEITADQKYTALTNAGFYYETLDQAQQAGIKAGLIYVVGENKLYLAKEGQLSEFIISSSTSNNEGNSNNNTTLKELQIGDLKISNEFGYVKFNTTKNHMWFSFKGDQYIIIGDELIQVYKSIVLNNGVSIQSPGADSNNGFRLYSTENGSVLEVDSIVWRNQDIELTSLTQALNEVTIFGKDSNVILSAIEDGGLDDLVYITCTLKYINSFQPLQSIYTFISQEISKYIINIYVQQTSTGTEITAIIDQELLAPQPIIIEVSYNEQTTLLTIPKDQERATIELSIQNVKIGGYRLVSGPSGVEINGEKFYVDIIKGAIKEYKVNAVNGQNITLEVPKSESISFINGCRNQLIYLANSQVTAIVNNTIILLDRSKVVQEEIIDESGIPQTVEKPDDTIHTKIGTIQEQEFDSLKICPVDEEGQVIQEEVQIGIYTDNFIGLNSKLYDTVFKKRCDYPKYDQSVTIPKDFQKEEYNKIVPDIEWVKELIKLAVPSGTIAMFNGQSELPEGWVICDGTNGTPNLIGKFIKAVDTPEKVGDNETQLNENNELTLTQEHLPQHNHPHEPHTHNISVSGTTGDSGNLTVDLRYSDYNYGINYTSKSVVASVTGEGITSDTTSVNSITNVYTQGGEATGGNHAHSVSLDTDLEASTSIEQTKEWVNKPIKIEPRSYSLIFIMKL